VTVRDKATAASVISAIFLLVALLLAGAGHDTSAVVSLIVGTVGFVVSSVLLSDE
jgi:hypothetical protein